MEEKLQRSVRTRWPVNDEPLNTFRTLELLFPNRPYCHANMLKCTFDKKMKNSYWPPASQSPIFFKNRTIS